MRIATNALQANPAAAPKPASVPIKEEIAEVYGDKVSLYEFSADGKLKPSGDGTNAPHHRGALSRLKEVFVPSNMPNSVSKDYIPTRKWTFARDIFSNAAGSATAAGVLSVFGVDPHWALLQAPLNMAKDRFCQVVGFGTSFGAPLADRNPRAWIMAGEAIEHAGMVLEAAAPLPGMFIPAFFGGPLVRILSGSMKGAAMANIDVRQAVGDNLGELRAKNGNQSFVSSLVGSLAGLAAAQTLHNHIGPVAYPLVAAVGATVAVGCMTMMVKNLEYQPVNEKALRTIIAGVEKDNKVPQPERSPWKPALELHKGDKLRLGQSIREVAGDQQRFEELKGLYKGRNYLLEVKQGQPCVVLREDCSAQDRFSAAHQALYVERLVGGEDYQARVAQQGQEAADRWVTEASLKKTPADPKPMLALLKKAGWTSDLVRFNDLGNRARWGSTLDEVTQFELPLPVPQQPGDKPA